MAEDMSVLSGVQPRGPSCRRRSMGVRKKRVDFRTADAMMPDFDLAQSRQVQVVEGLQSWI